MVPVSGVKLVRYLAAADGEILPIDVDIAGIDRTGIDGGPVLGAVVDVGPIVGPVVGSNACAFGSTAALTGSIQSVPRSFDSATSLARAHGQCGGRAGPIQSPTRSIITTAGSVQSGASVGPIDATASSKAAPTRSV